MVDATAPIGTMEPTQKAPLGVGGIISESFSILFKKFIAVIALSFLPTLFSVAFPLVFFGWNTLATDVPPNPDSAVAAIGLTVFVQFAIYGLVTAMVVQLAYDAKLQRDGSLGQYFGRAARAIVPVVLVTVVVSIVVALGFALLIIPGLWLLAVFAVATPAVVIEGLWLKAIGRSSSLSKGYRWPIVGAMILIGICNFIINFGGQFVGGMLSFAGGGSLVVGVLLMAIASAFATGLAGISISLIYARLREIKEGVSVEQIASVFD